MNNLRRLSYLLARLICSTPLLMVYFLIESLCLGGGVHVRRARYMYVSAFLQRLEV